MGLDALSPVAPARIGCLALPCGKITRSRFLAFVYRLQQETIVRLGDVSPNAGPTRNMFTPLAFPTGLAVYDISTSLPSPSQLALAPFELYREPLVIIGIADGVEYSEERTKVKVLSRATQDAPARGLDGAVGIASFEELSRTVDLLREKYPSGLLHKVLIFDFDQNSASMLDGLIPVPSLKNSKTTTIKTVMCDLSSLLLGEMTGYARSLLALPNIETPNSSQRERSLADRASSGFEGDGIAKPESRISGTPTSRSSSPAADTDRLRHRASVQGYPVAADEPAEGDRSRPQSNGHNTPPISFDQMNGLPGVGIKLSNKEKGRQPSKDRIPVQGFGSGSVGERARTKAKGRVGVVLGSMYLLAGRWPDAVKELVESATVARAISDHVWHAKALDYILVCLLMCAWAGMDFEIPQICYPLGEKSSPGLPKPSKHTPQASMPDLAPLKSPNAANRLVSLQNLCTLLPDLVNNILHLYVRAATFTADQLPQVAFSESTIRFAKLMAVIENSHGTLDDAGLQAIVLNVGNRSNPSLIPSQLAPFPSKADIAAVLLRALPTPTMDRSLDMKDRINILAGIASVLAKLRYHRKKAFILRELVITLLPALVQSRKDNAAEMGVHPAATLSSFDHIGDILDYEEIFDRNERSEPGSQLFLTTLCEVYGVVLPPSPVLESATDAETDGDTPGPGNTKEAHLDESMSIANRALDEAFVRCFGDLGLKIDVLRLCINMCEALPDLRGVLRFSIALLKTVGSGTAPGSKGGGVPALPVEDQRRLLNSISRTTTAAKKLGLDDPEAEYWDEFLVRDVEITRASSLMSPISRGKSQLYASLPEGAEAKEGPFIYNPFIAKPSSTVAEPLLIAGEEAIFTVWCQNLYEVDMEIEWMKLDTSEVVMSFLTRNVLVAPLRTQSVQIAGTPKSSGLLKISGCVVKVKGCRERHFPIFRSQWRGVYETKVKSLHLAGPAVAAERPVTSASASEYLPSHRVSSTKAPVPAIFAVNVIESQPNMVVKATSLSQSAIMLLEGETQRFKVTLCNVSPATPVDLLLLSFNDSTSTLLHSALANKDLSPAELYEVEHTSYRKESFKWRRQSNDPDPTIVPGSELTLEIEVVGKPGLTHGAIFIDYGYLGVPRSLVKDNFYTRQVHVPITVTVNPSVHLTHNDFLPFSGDFAWLNQQRQHLNPDNSQAPSSEKRPRPPSRISTTPQSRFQPLLERLGLGTQGTEHCLLLLDFHNAWPNPLSISVQVREKTTPQDPSLSDLWKRAYTVHELIQPGHTSRLVLLLPRIVLSNPHAPIPSLRPSSKRQFILSTNKASGDDSERAAREAFWLREEVLKLMRASWTDDLSGRTGDIELRALRLSPRMIDAIKLEEVAVDLSLSSDPPSSATTSTSTSTDSAHHPPVRQLARSTFLAPASTFLTLTTTLTNRLPHAITPLLRLQPSLRHQAANVALDLGKKFAFNGVLQRVLPVLAPGESTAVMIGVVWLCTGAFEIRACVEELRVWTGVGEEGVGVGEKGGRVEVDVDLEGVGERTERRVWWGREACVVDVVDGGGGGRAEREGP